LKVSGISRNIFSEKCSFNVVSAFEGSVFILTFEVVGILFSGTRINLEGLFFS
jgi:hypothetical protein